MIASDIVTINAEIKAHVGNELINSGDVVKEGEVVKYTFTIRNNGIKTLKDVKLVASIPDKTVLVKPIRDLQVDNGGEIITIPDGYVYIDGYYEEIVDIEKIQESTVKMIAELNPGQIEEIEYEVRINKDTSGGNIENKLLVIYDGVEIQSDKCINEIKKSDIRVTVKRAIPESDKTYTGGTMQYIAYVENLSNIVINDLEIKILSEEFDVSAIKINEEIFENVNTISINELKPTETDGKLTLDIYGTIKNDATELKLTAVVNDSNGNKYRGNQIIDNVQNVDAKVTLTSPQNEKYIQEGDLVEYKFVIENIGDSKSKIEINDKISEFLKIQEIRVNNKIDMQITNATDENTYVENISNNLMYYVYVEPGQKVHVDIISKVQYIPKMYNGKVITNSATFDVYDIEKGQTQIISHILNSNQIKEEDSKNLISGFAWYDKNSNGIKENNEEMLSNIKVKLFDTSTNNYVLDEDKNIIEYITNNNGQYVFENITKGSYLIIFEYDAEQYTITKVNADKYDISLNSKAEIKTIKVNGNLVRIAAIEVNELNSNMLNMNIGLIDNTGDIPNDEKPGITEEPEDVQSQKTITGFAWIDSNRDGKKDDNEKKLPGIKVRLYNLEKREYILETVTQENGQYKFNNVEKDAYIIVFEYDTENYEPTIYKAEGVDSTINSKAIIDIINVDGKNKIVAVTDTINVEDNIYNINIGLKEKIKFDLELNKYISKIIVQDSKDTKTYEYNEKTLAKIEIHRKKIQESLVVIEYTIEVKNTGELAGYVKNIIDYLPSGLTFSSELNKEWYVLDNNAYTKKLENTELKPGEKAEVKLILTKKMTSENVGLLNNRAEIYEVYNIYGELDIDSTPNNQIQDEDDFGYVDIIIAISTGGTIISYIILVIINVVLISIAISMMKKSVIIEIKKERR